MQASENIKHAVYDKGTVYVYSLILCRACVACLNSLVTRYVEMQGKSNKSTTPRTALPFQRKEEELPWVRFEPTTRIL